MSRSTAPHRFAAFTLATAMAVSGMVIGAENASAAVVRPFTLGFNEQVYGDFIEVGNGNSRCPNVGDPAPFAEPTTSCAPAQARTYTAGTGVNDQYYMRWADVDADAASYNSSRASLTVPAGATVRFARLNWSGDTGIVRNSDGTVSPLPGCSSNQFAVGAGSAIVPPGTPESTSVRLTVGAGATTAVAPQVISRDPLATVPASQPQFYAAHANVTSSFTAAPTGVPLTVDVGNVWTPQGFNCYSGWSLVLVYAFDGPTAAAPGKREVYVYDGHVRQSSIDPPTTTTIAGFRASSANVRVGVTAYEGDFNIVGDQFSINGTPLGEPLAPATTTNFFVSNANGRTAPNVPNNMSVDAKAFTTSLIPAGSTTANLTFSTSGDTYLAQNLVFSVPVPSIEITKELVSPGPYRPGQPVTYRITVVSPGGSNAVNVAVTDPAVSDCNRSLGTLVADVPVVYTCTGPAPGDDFTNVATVTAQDPFGDQLTDTDEVDVPVVNPAIEITKEADQPSYAAGETITFTIVVTNTGDADLTAVTVADPTVPTCATTRPALAPGAFFTYTCTATAPIPGDENTATATGVDPLGGTVTDTDTAPAPSVGTVSGRVFADRDNDGTADADDTGIGGVTVTLTGTTAAGAPVNLTTTTAADGAYSFPDVPGGTYRIVETQPAAYDDGIDTPGAGAAADGNDAFSLTLAPGTSSAGNDFAELPTSSLSGVVYDDLDGDGVRDGDEPGIGGVTMTLTGTDDGGNAVSLTTTTAADGSYTFPALRPGTYRVDETQPAGYTDGVDSAGSAGGAATPPDSITGIELPARTDATAYLFSEYRGGSIAGQVVDETGAGIPDVAVTLTRPDGSTATTTTDAEGNYAFTDLPPGTYSVAEAQPDGYADGPETPGSAGGTVGEDVFTGIVLASGVDATGYVFAEDRGSIAGVVYEDANNNGLQDAGEPGIPGATVTLTGTDARGNPVERTAVSGPDGSYTFAGVVGGDYALTETQPTGYDDGLDTPGTAGGAATPPDSITGIALDAGEDATGYLFGEFVVNSITGRVVDDLGRGIPDVEMTLTRPDGTTATTTTDAEGRYAFTGLPPGTYSVAETQPDGYGDGPETVGDAGGDASVNDVISGIVLVSGGAATGYDFAEDTGSLAGSVYVDQNNNGVRDPGETGIPDVPVTVTGTDVRGNPVDITVLTGPDGGYLVTGLVAGDYTVTEAQPDGYLDGADAAGDAGGTPAEPDSVAGVALGVGQDATGYTFGELVGGSISGRVVDDAGNPIAGVELTLTEPDGSTRTTVTDAEGNYTFTGLRPGSHTVTETQPTGYGDGPETVGDAGGDASVNDVVSGIVIESGTQAAGYVFAESRGSLAGSVYEDTNGNGVRDPDEPGIPGATVTLTGTDDLGDPVSAVATTADDGSYLFAGLISGEYTITETQPAGYDDGADAAGTAGGTPTGPDSVTAIALGGGVNGTGYTFGEFRTGSISGSVVDDRGNPIAGVEVTLTGPGGPLTTTTAPDGTYTFTDLPPGTYTLTETQPAAYGDGPETPGSAGGDASVDDVISGIALGSGVAATDYVFTETSASLAGVVYEDRNGNGVRDDGEPGIPGVTVVASGVGPDRTAVTDADGAYSFVGLPAGDYTLTETQPDGYLDGIDAAGSAGGAPTEPDSITAIPVGPGEAATDYLFGEYRASSVSGRVVDDGGNPIPGVEVTLTGPNGTTTVTTDEAGNYTFPGLTPGTYTVTETQPDGYGDGPDTPGDAGGDASVDDVISGIVIGSGVDATGYVFAEDRGSLSGAVYEDVNGNGTRDRLEPGISGVEVTLTGTDVNGNPVDVTVTTDEDGGYTFPNVVGGTYAVIESQPEGYADGADTAGTAGGTPSGRDSITGVVLGGGEDATGYLFGEFRTASLSGRVVDDGGNAIPGVEITLTGPNGTTTVTTDEAGNYTFPGLTPGTYTVTETQPDGYGDGPDFPGSAGGDIGQDTFTNVEIRSGHSATGYDFTEDRGSLSGVVYEDRNDNGAQDPGEPGIPGVTATLTGTDALGREVDRTAVTDANGGYTFADVVGGTYAITETQPPGYADGQDTPGTAGGTLAPPDGIQAIELAGGEDATGYLFGERGGAITGTVWVDVNGDGVIDADEPRRLSGVTVVLLDADGAELARTVTDDEGGYTFADLPAGDYTVRQLQPDAYGSTTPNDVPVTVAPGGGGSADFGEQQGLIGDLVFDDTDRDGVQDFGEPGVPGVTVVLLDATGAEVARTTTDADGRYRFTDVPPGTYRISVEAPDGQVFTRPGAGGEAVDSDIDPATGLSGPIAVTVTDGRITQTLDVDAGLVPRVLDLAVDLTVDRPTATVGDRVTFTDTVANTGTIPVEGARTTITIPEGLTIVSAGGEGWTCETAGQTVTCTTEAVLQPGDSAPPVTVVTQAAKPVATTDATATVATGDGTPDANPDNDRDTTPVTVTAPGTKPPTPPAPRPPGPNPPGELPNTGAEVLTLLYGALAFLALGAALVRSVRHRRAR